MVSTDILSTNCDAIKNFFSISNEEDKLVNFDKLLSCLDDENHINEIMSYSQNLDTNIQTFNASANTVKLSNDLYSEINHTRGGYLYKIINNLLIMAPSVFAPYMLKNAAIKKSLIKNCQCKSVAMILITLLTLPQNNNNNTNNMMNTPNAINFQMEPQNNTLNQGQNEVFNNTLQDRKALLNDVMVSCISTVDKIELLDLQNNLCYLLNNLFTREYTNKTDFIKYIVDGFFEKFMEAFMHSKEDNLGNKLGVVVLSIFGTF